MCKDHRGIAIPAHIDREANGLLSTLGGMPERPDFPTIEVHDAAKLLSLVQKHPALQNKRAIVSSDAHSIREIAEQGYALNLPCPSEAGAQEVRDRLIDYLSGQRGGII